MAQYTLGLEPLPKKTRKEVFLEEMNQVLPWAVLVALIAPFARGAHQSLGGPPRRKEMQVSKVKWHVAMRPGKRKALDPKRELDDCGTRWSTRFG